MSALTVSPGTLSPDFDPAITAYNLIVGAGVSSISFTPTFRAGTVVIEVARVFGGMISSGSTSSRGFSGTRATYNIAVTNGGVSTTYSVTATRNTAPVADAGDDDTAATNAPVALDGSGSSDPNSHVGDTLTYAWEHTLTNGTAPATAITLPDATAENPTFTPTAAGAYTFTLTVTDSVGASHTDTVVITVTEPVDTTAPTVTLGTIAEGVIGTAQDHVITFDEAVTGLAVGDFSVSNNIVVSGDLVVNSVTPASGPSTTYTISITPQATAFTLTLAADSVMDTATTPNPGPANAASASGSATAVLAFTAAPALTTNNADPQRAKAGDILTLTFTVNQALASVPVVVTIAGQPITPTGTAGNVYTATYTVVAAEVTDEGAVVSYSTGRLTAAGPAGNTAQITDDSAIRIDLTAPTIALTGGDAPVVLTVGGTYTEPGATATDNVDTSVPTPTWSGAVDTDTAGEYTITYTATDRAGNVATKTRTVTVSEPAATAPEPPVLSAGTITDTSVVLEWTAVDNADSYTLTRVVDGGANVVVATATNELTATDTGLTAETAYKYVVTVTVGGRTSANSNEVDATTLATPAPDIATLVIKATTHNSITLSWGAVDNADSYTVTRVVAGGADVEVFSGNALTATDENLDADTEYKYTIAAINSAGTSTSTEFSARTVAAPGTTPAPTVTVERLPDNSIKVSWDNILGVDFTIYAITTGVADVEIIDLAASPHTIATTDPLFDTVNDADGIGIRGFSEGNPVGDHSAQITSDEVPDEAPNPPTLVAGTITDTSVVITWEAQTGAADYLLYQDGTPLVPAVTGTTHTVTGLTAGTTYSFTAESRTSDSVTGSRSSALSVTTIPATPALRLGAVTDTSITLSWDAVTNAASYTLRRIVAGGADEEAMIPSRLLTFTDTNVAPDTEYKYVITATNSAGTSAPSAEFSARTDAAPDITPPTVITFDDPAAGVIGTAQDHDITFSEAVTGLAVGDFSVSNNIVASGDLVVNSVTPASGPGTTYTISITPRATAFTLTLAIDSVMDTATTPNMGPATAASAIGTAAPAPTPTNTAPVVSGNAAPNYAENASGAETYAATDAESNAIAWSVTGTDASFFAIDADGELTFSTSPDFEDAHGATYSITITATETNGDPGDLTGELAVTVTVTNVDEDGAISAITGTAQIGVALTAGTVTDPDGAVNVDSYEWQSAASGGTYTPISGAGTTSTYTPVATDVGRTIRVVATYTDGHGSDKTATSAATRAVLAAVVTPPAVATPPRDNTAPVLTYDRFTHTGGVADGAITRLNAGDTLTVFVNSNEPLAASSLTDAAIFILDDANRPAQALLRVGVTNQYMATYTIEDADHDKGLQCSVSGVMDAAGNRAADFTSPSLPVSIDTEPPVITLSSASPALVAHGGEYTDRSVNGVNTGAGETLATVITGPAAMTVNAVDTTAAGDYTYTYTATDRAGNVSTPVTRTVTVSAANTPPVAHAGGDQAVDTGASVTLNGSGSSDPDGDTLRYAWTQDSGTDVTLSDPTAARPTFDAPDAAGELVFTLTVTDDADPSASHTAMVTVTVTRPRDTVAPVITLLGDSPLEVNQGATYTDPGATASDDTDGDLDSAGIVVGGDTVDTDTIGAYNVTYDVSDAAGNAAATVTRIVRVVVVRDLAALNEAILPEVARDIADRNVSAIARRIEQARLPSRTGSSASLGGASSLAEIATSQGSTVADGRFDLKRLLNNSNFVLQLHETGAGAADGTQLTLWGAGDYRDLKGADEVRWSGDLFSLQLGLDAHLNERTILGVSVSGSKVELNYTNPGPAAGGNYDLDMTSVHPYLGWTAGGLDFWATLGYGEGELEISADGAQADIPSSDLSMQTLGLGANGVLMATGTTTLLLKTEILSTQLEVDASEEITAITQQAHRMRMTLEAIRGHSLNSGARLETSLEAGLRYDGGETGAGAELGGGLRYANHSGGLVIEGKARALVGGKGDTEEWGLSGLITYNPAANGRGLSFSLTPSYGATASGVERLWQQGLDDGLEAQGGNDGYNYTPNLNLRLDYGMDVSGMPGLVTPYTEFSFGATGDTYRLGLQWQRSKWFDLKLVAEREAGQITADHRIYIEGELVF